MSLPDLRRRFALGAAVGILATIAYRSIQWATASRAAIRYDCWSWRLVPFHPDWIWPYFSMFLLVGLPWFLLPDFRRVTRFAACLLATAAIGWAVFFIYPTACARPATDSQPFFYLVLRSCDRADNCLPCLHAAFSVLAAWALACDGPGVFRRPQGRIFLAVLLAAICTSSVALRQHTGMDAAAGTLLGAAAAWAWTRMTVLRTSAEPPVVPETLFARQARNR